MMKADMNKLEECIGKEFLGCMASNDETQMLMCFEGGLSFAIEVLGDFDADGAVKICDTFVNLNYWRDKSQLRDWGVITQQQFEEDAAETAKREEAWRMRREQRELEKYKELKAKFEAQATTRHTEGSE